MTYPYEIEVMLGSEGAVSSPSLLFSSGFNPSPSPSGDLVKIITDSFEVTNDGGSTMKEAYSVAEIKKGDWEYLKSQFSPSTYTLMLSNQGDAWSGTIVCNGLDACMILLSEDTPTEEHPDPHCSFTTIGARVFNMLGEEIPLPSGGTITIKTYIDGEENSDDTYRPAAAGSSEVSAHVEGDTPIVEEWLWQSGEINVSEHSPLIFKMALVNIKPEYEDLEDFIKGIDSWNVLGTYREALRQYDISIVKTLEGYNYGVSIPNTGSGYKTAATPILMRINASTSESQNIGIVSVKAFNSETGEEWDEDTFTPLGSVEINTTMTKI